MDQRPYTKISALVNNSDKAVMYMRATRIWRSFNPYDKKPLYTNVILMDEEGNHIWAMIRNNQRATYMKTLEEDKVFIISKVMVVSAPEKYRSVKGELSINFYHETKVEKTVDTGIIPKYKFELKDFGKINELVGDVRFFIDVIGWVVSYGDVYTTEKGFKKLDVQLLNDRKETMTVSLWGDRGPEFLAKLGETGDVPIFTVLTCLLAKTYFDELALSSGDGTKYFFNIDYQPLNDLKAAILDSIGATTDTLNAPSHKPLIRPGIPDVLKATVKDILEMKLPLEKSYRVSVTVEDSSGTTTFTLFNKDAELLIGVPIERLITEIEEVHLSNDIPAVVGNIVGKTCAFEVKVTSYNISRRIEDYVVAKVTDCQNTPRTETNGDEASSSSTKKRKMA